MLKLYHYPISPYGWIARMALAEKGLDYESHEPWDRNDNPEMSEYNPLNRTPTLVCDGKGVYESMAIAEFLEERHPERPLLPMDAFSRAHVRALCSIIQADLLPEVAKLGRAVLDFKAWDIKSGQAPPQRAEVDAAARDEAAANVERVLGNLVKASTRDPFLAGPFSLADIALTPLATNLGFRDFDLAARAAPVAAWLTRIRQRPSYAASKPPYAP